MTKERFEQTCWNKFATEKFDTFMSWVGDHTIESKVFVRKYINSQGHKSVVDVGCGPATDFHGYKADNFDIQYTGVDSSHIMAIRAGERGASVIVSPIEEITLPDNYADVAYCRHVLEHLPSFRDGIPELLRIARKETLVTFFLNPGTDPEKIDYSSHENMYHNVYNKKDIEDYLLTLPKVESFRWELVAQRECVLFIKLKA